MKVIDVGMLTTRIGLEAYAERYYKAHPEELEKLKKMEQEQMDLKN